MIISVCTVITVLSSQLRFADTPSRAHLTPGRRPVITPAGCSEDRMKVDKYGHALYEQTCQCVEWVYSKHVNQADNY